MTENLTESFRLWPWAPWLLLVGVCFVAEMFRRDGWAATLVAGCLAGAAVSALSPLPAPAFGAFVLATGIAVALTKPWRAEDLDADDPRR